MIKKIINFNKKLNINIDKLKVNLVCTNTLKASNITNGYYGKIFQNSFKNLWAMSYGTKLQVFKANKNKDVYVYLRKWQNK